MSARSLRLPANDSPRMACEWFARSLRLSCTIRAAVLAIADREWAVVATAIEVCLPALGLP
eukprot:11573965-Alexandrium_andersonii.AAC.1